MCSEFVQDSFYGVNVVQAHSFPRVNSQPVESYEGQSSVRFCILWVDISLNQNLSLVCVVLFANFHWCMCV